MASFDTIKMPPKSTIKFLTTACTLYCVLLTATISLSLTTTFPLDLVGNPISSVQIIAFVMGISYIAVATVSSARFSGKILVKCFFLVGLSCMVYHCICILFGAPVIESSRETFHFAMLLSTLTVVPLCCLYGPDISKWAKLYASSRPTVGAEMAVYLTSVCTLFGAWVGAIPIPLDWDRPWQVWPVSCVLGALFGYCIGLLIAAIYIPYQYKQLYKMKLI